MPARRAQSGDEPGAPCHTPVGLDRLSERRRTVMTDARQRERAEQFKRLHDRSKLLILPNVWDVVSARAFEELGFPALATSSAGVAAVLGYADGQLISRGEMVEMARRIAAALSIPLTADMESGYEAVAETVREILAAGVVGVNLEDGRPDEKAIVPTSEQVERIREARASACPWPSSAGGLMSPPVPTVCSFPAWSIATPSPSWPGASRRRSMYWPGPARRRRRSWLRSGWRG